MSNKKLETPKSLYKYRSLQNLKRVLDILEKGELYAAKLNELNDPMEAYFDFQNEKNVSVKNMKENFKKAYICSLSKSHDIGLMWSHYADGHNGCCIEVEAVDSEEWQGRDVYYDKDLKKISESKSVYDLLKIKSEAWKYEDEYRYIKVADDSSKEKSTRLKVKVKHIYLGVAVSDNLAKFYQELFVSTAHHLKDKDVTRLTTNDIKW